MTTKKQQKEEQYDYDQADQDFIEEIAKQLTVGRVIQSHRKSEGWSQVETAKKLGISSQQLSDYEKGRKLPSISKAWEIASILGMHPGHLISRVLNEQFERENIPLRVEKLVS
jgi:transcriptional regulator with XRE-family HTH domain